MPQDGPAARQGGAGRHSLQLRLLVALNVAMVAVLAAFMAWDYGSERHVRLSERRAALADEARSLLAGVELLRDSQGAVQRFIDDVCAQMQESTSPGHHIAVEMGGQVLQARAHRVRSDKFPGLMREGASKPHGLVGADGEWIIVGMAGGRGVSLFVSEDVADIQRWLRGQLVRRVLAVLCLGLALAIVVNLVVGRFVTRPLNSIVAAVRRIKGGQVGTRAPVPPTSELAFLADELNAMSSALAEVERDRQRQMAKAQRIQEHLVPVGQAALGPSVVTLYRPAEYVAGDYFDRRTTDDGTEVFCVADVSGHGVPAALLAAMLKTLFVAACEVTSEPRHILGFVNQRFGEVSLDEDYASMIVVRVAEGRRLTYASAGHEPAYVLRAGGGTEVLSATGPVLGFQGTGSWDETVLEVKSRDRLVMVTDGVPEAASKTGELLGRERLRELLEANPGEPLSVLCQRIVGSVDAQCAGAKQADDVTVVAVEF